MKTRSPYPSSTPACTPLPYARLLILLGAGTALLLGLNLGLHKLGAHAIPISANTNLADMGTLHGPIMICGFLATVIGLERAVALQANTRQLWAYLAPLSAIAGTLTAIATKTHLIPTLALAPYWNEERALASILWGISAITLCAIYTYVATKRALSAPVLIEILSAVALLVGTLLWGAGHEVGAIVYWWLIFIILTIIAERLELAHLAFTKPGLDTRIVTQSAGVLFALIIMMVSPTIGTPLLGFSLAVLIIEVARHDVARQLIRSHGLVRFSAAAMLAGYAYAGIGALVWIFFPYATSGYTYDVAVHSITIGFAVSMIVAHAPVIIPGVIRRDIPYHPIMWVVLALVHAGLAVRVFGASHQVEALWRLGGAWGVCAFLAFLITTVTLTIRANRTGGDA